MLEFFWAEPIELEKITIMIHDQPFTTLISMRCFPRASKTNIHTSRTPCGTICIYHSWFLCSWLCLLAHVSWCILRTTFLDVNQCRFPAGLFPWSPTTLNMRWRLIAQTGPFDHILAVTDVPESRETASFAELLPAVSWRGTWSIETWQAIQVAIWLRIAVFWLKVQHL